MNDRRSNLGRNFRVSQTARRDTTSSDDVSCFKLAGERDIVRRVQFQFATGRIVSLPYAFLPVVDYEPDEDLKLLTSGVIVTLTGRGLNILARHFNDERVLWIGESGSGLDDESQSVFISSITIEGDLID